MKGQHLSDQQESIIIHSRTQHYRAVPLPGEEENIFTVSTAKKSSVVPQSICQLCGTRMGKHQMKACQFCGAVLCEACYQQALERCPASDPDDE